MNGIVCITLLLPVFPYIPIIQETDISFPFCYNCFVIVIIIVIAFTIASAPHENSMCFYIKAVGDWTEELRKTFEDRLSGIISEPLTVRIRGPFGAPAQHVGGYQRVVLISGGVGATPFSSICKDLYHKLSFNDRYDDSESSSCGAEDPASLSKARQEIMRCVTDVYEQNNAIDYGQEEDCRNAVPLSLSNMFAETNEMAPSASYALSPMKKNAVGVPHLQDVKVSDQGSPVCNKGSEDLAYLRRLGYTSRAMGMQYNTGYETQRHKWSPTKGLDSRFVEHTLCMDTIRAASAVRNEVSSDRKERMMLFLHTVLMNFFLLALMLIRLVLVAYASIFRSSMLYTSNISSNRIFDTWLAGSEVSLGIFMMVLIGSTLCLEIMVYRSGFFKSRGRVTDLVLLFPISILSVFAGIHKLARQKFEPFFPRWVHFAVLVPILVILLFYRLFRVVGSRVLLADTYSDSSFEKMRAIDYIWTVPYEDDDDWLREELEPLANGEHLRLHRFVTRQERNAEEGGKYTRGGMHTNFG